MKWGSVSICSVVGCAILLTAHFFVGIESRVFAQEHTGLLRRVVRIGFPFWKTEWFVLSERVELMETPYSLYLRERLPSFDSLQECGRWISASGEVRGVLYDDKHKFVSSSGFEMFPLPSIRNESIYEFLVYATRQRMLTPQLLSELIAEGNPSPLVQRELETEYKAWAEASGGRDGTVIP